MGIVEDEMFDWVTRFDPLTDLPKHRFDTAVTAADRADPKNPAPIDGLPLGTKQILDIRTYSIISSGFLANQTDKKTYSRLSVMVLGQPSPSSSGKLNHGYLNFTKTANLKPPSYNHARGRIDIYIDVAFLQATLLQLEHPKKYLWIGQYAGGHLYADIHSTP